MLRLCWTGGWRRLDDTVVGQGVLLPLLTCHDDDDDGGALVAVANDGVDLCRGERTVEGGAVGQGICSRKGVDRCREDHREENGERICR